MTTSALGTAYFRLAARGVTLAGSAALLLAACSSDDPKGNPGAGGNGAAGHSSAGSSGNAGGHSNAGSAGASAGSSGSSGGSAGGSSGSSGSSGNAGSAGMACVNVPEATPHGSCNDIPSQAKGDPGLEVTSKDFSACGTIPANMTCDGHDFGTGVSPEFKWTGAPAGTLSFAAVFKDISILADGVKATEKFGYHWVMWDIPASVTGLPGALSGGYSPLEVPGAHQWSTLGSYGFFTPCPNPFPKGAPQFMCSLTLDSYSFTLYALPVAKLEDLPAPDLDPATGMPVAGSNWVVNMAHYIESLPALAVAEYRGTSKAWAAAFVPPNAAQFPCTKGGGSGGSGGSAGNGGVSGSAGTSGTSGASGSAGNGGASAGASGTSGASGSAGNGGASGSGGVSGSAGASSGGSSGGGGASGAAMCLK